MKTKEDAIQVTNEFIMKSSIYKECEVDENNITDKGHAWYISFKGAISDLNNIVVGAYTGLIVDKKSLEYMQPGSALTLDEWLYEFKIGIRGGRYDLKISKVNRLNLAVELLEQLALRYVKKEVKYDIEWKIPNRFTREEIINRLTKLPCTFKNQNLSFCGTNFKEIREKEIFKYELLKSHNSDPTLLGELIT